MFEKYSVRRPYTVFVAVVLVIVLGFISFFGMTTDLLPSMELPYVLVITSYPGASPEQVEAAVTQPLEAALGTASGLSSISSVSQENSSMIILEFEQETNMDSAMIDLSSSTDLVRDALPDTASSPMLMRISPDMLPVMVASVDCTGMDVNEVSALVADSLDAEFERLDGVASVSATGLVTDQITVTLDQEKIKALNEKVKQGIDAQMAEAQAKIDEGRAEIADGKAQLTAGQTQLADQKTALYAQLAAGSAKVDAAIAQLSSLSGQQQAISAAKETLQAAVDAYLSQNEQLAQIAAALQQLGISFPATLEELIAMDPAEFTALRDMAAAQLALTNPELAALVAGLDQAQLSQLLSAYQAAEQALGELEQQLNQLDQMQQELEQGLSQAQDGYAQLEAGKMTAVGEMTKADLLLQTTKAQLDEAEAQLDEAQTQLDEAKQAAYEQADLTELLTPQLISQILTAQNFSMPAGYLNEDGVQYLVKVGDAYQSLEEVQNAVILDLGMDEVGPIRLCDVASVRMTDDSGESYAKVNGNEAVVLSFQKQSTASTAEVTDRIHQTIDRLEAENEGLHITPLMDQGQYIDLITDSVLQNLLMGGVLAVLVLVVFLKDPKPTLIIACSIPISLMFAVVLMYFTGLTLNLISLSGLALGVGMLVDNSIVVIENIYRLRSRGLPAAKAAVQGAKEVAGAIAASTLTTICVFLPIVFTEGLSRQLFTDMGLTIGYSLTASLVVALTLVPAMGSTVLQKVNKKQHPWFDRLLDGYEKLLRMALGHRAVTLCLAGGLLVVAVFGAATMGTAFIPSMDSSEMSLTLTMPQESTQEDLYQTSDEVMERICALDGVETVGAMASGGSSSLMGSGSDGSVTMYILLQEDRTVTNEQVSQNIYAATADLPCEISVSASTMDMSALGGSGVSVRLEGNDLDDLTEACQMTAELLGQVEGLTDVTFGDENPGIETRVTVNKDAAMAKGLTVAQVYQELAGALSTETTSTTLSTGGKDYAIVIVDESSGMDRESLANYPFTVTNAQGEEESFVLSDIAQITEQTSLSAVNREGGSRYMTVTAAVADGYNIGLVSRDMEQKLADLKLPAGVNLELAGENETINSALFDLVKMIALAIVFIYLIMVAQFQSLLSPFIVLFTIPLAFTGGLLLLWVCGMELSVIAMLGFLVLSGVVVNNGIVFVDYANQLWQRGMSKREALVQCGRTRMRPILMTALTTILAMSTMALGIGDGAEMTQPMAVVTIGGLSYATLLTLVVVPVIYDIFCRKQPKQVDLGQEEEED